MKKVIKDIFRRFGFELSNINSLQELSKVHAIRDIEKTELENSIKKIQFLLEHACKENKEQIDLEGFLHFIGENLKVSSSQIFQDLFVLYILKEKRNGFFVDFGATNGIELNNSYLLEKKYGWKGILAEPARVWENSLKKNRNNFIDTRCVWSSSCDTLKFTETNNPILSSISSFSDKDFLSNQRTSQATYEVSTVSLNDLLLTYNAPHYIDYLSIDTEGSEFEILQAFDFEKYSIGVITVEHNFTPQREQILKLFTEKGYTRIFNKISLFDDWYIKN